MLVPDSQIRHLFGDAWYMIAVALLVVGAPFILLGSVKLVGLLGHHPSVSRALGPPKMTEREGGDPADFGALATLLWLLLVVVGMIILTWSVWNV